MKRYTVAQARQRLAEALDSYASERNASVNGLVREFLAAIAEREDRARQARKRIRELSRSSKARLGPRSWTRHAVRHSPPLRG